MFIKHKQDLQQLSDTLLCIPLPDYLYLYDLVENKSHLITIPLPSSILKDNFILDVNRSLEIPDDMFDLETLFYIKNATEIPYEMYFEAPERMVYRRGKNPLNTPLATQIAFCERLAIGLKDVVFQSSVLDKHTAQIFYKNCVIPFRELSTQQYSGIDKRKFAEHYPKTPIPKSFRVRYNLFTRTSRPKIEVSPLPIHMEKKESGKRECLISQTGGKIISFDYDSFHLRLVAEEAGCSFDTSKSAHKIIAQDIYQMSTIPKEIYDKVKASIFRILYSNNLSTETETIDHPILSKTREFGERKLKELQDNGVIFSAIHNRPMYAKNFPALEYSKALSYYILSKETEIVGGALMKLHELLKDKQTKILIVLYDAIFFDLAPNEDYLLPQLQSIITYDGKYPVKYKEGTSFAL